MNAAASEVEAPPDRAPAATGPPSPPGKPRGVPAALTLDFERRRDATCMLLRHRHGPLAVQRAFQPGDGACHAYVLHPPGGIVGGDELVIEARVRRGAHALLTTPAWTKVYRSGGRKSRAAQRIDVDAGGCVEWLPQETLLFCGADFALHTAIHARSDSRFVAWESVVLGRAAMGESFLEGGLAQSLDVYVDGAPRLIDRQCLRARDAFVSAPWGLDGCRAFATMIAYPADADVLALARRALGAAATAGADSKNHSLQAAATLVDAVLVLRARASQSRFIGAVLDRAWQAVRPLVAGCTAARPRIWST